VAWPGSVVPIYHLALGGELFCNFYAYFQFWGDEAGSTQSDVSFLFLEHLIFAEITNLLANVSLYLSISRIFKVFGGCNQIIGEDIFPISQD